MAYSLKLLPVAKRDLLKAREWHGKKRSGLGEEFKQILDVAIDYVGENPHHCQRRYKELRLSLVKRFSYAIFYLIDEDRNIVIIFGVLHTIRNPEIARRRIK